VRFPLTFELHEFRPDSAGDGQHRGGVGSVLRLRVDTTEGRAWRNTAGDGTRHPSYGILGGRDGLPHRYRLLSRGRAPRVLKDEGSRHPGAAGRRVLRRVRGRRRLGRPGQAPP